MRTLATASALLLSGLGLAGAAHLADPAFTTDFHIEAKTFKNVGGNAYCSITPGRFWRYEGKEDGQSVRVDVKTLQDTKVISFKLKGKDMAISTRIVEEREWRDGVLVEVSRNFLARDLRGNVFNFGEEVDLYAGGKIVGHDGAWRAGVKSALPGLFVPELFVQGSRYHQAIAPGVAMDRVENVEMGLTIKTPAAEFKNCVKTLQTTPLEPDFEEIQVYAPGVGLIIDGSLNLVEFH